MFFYFKINHLICEMIHNSSNTIIIITTLKLRIFTNRCLYIAFYITSPFLNTFTSNLKHIFLLLLNGFYLKLQIIHLFDHFRHVWQGSYVKHNYFTSYLHFCFKILHSAYNPTCLSIYPMSLVSQTF
jgi:hypothetical protein